MGTSVPILEVAGRYSQPLKVTRMTRLKSLCLAWCVASLPLANAFALSGIQIAELVPLNSQGAPQFGSLYGHATAIDGDLVVVGNPFSDLLPAMFDSRTGTQALTSPPDDGRSNFLGVAVSVDNGIIAIGATNPPFLSGSLGARPVTIYDPLQDSYIDIPSPVFDFPESASHEFGAAISMEGGELLIGSYDSSFRGGFAHLYDVKTGGRVRSFAPPSGGSAFGQFGVDVAMDSDYVLVSDLFTRSVEFYERATGEHLGSLMDARLGSSGGSGDYLAVAVDEGVAVVGSPRENVALVVDVASRTVLHELRPDTAEPAGFGLSVDIDGTAVLVGASREIVGDGQQGAAYLFSSDSGDRLTKLVPEQTTFSRFGFSVAVQDDIAVIGQRGIAGSQTGAYLFRLVPEPNSSALAFGLLAFCGLTRRPKKIATS